ncbi:CSLREA domain-containing protein [Wenzhouxiangella sediminis]|nr:CSLREA domain-containing protein [Wenzhouxiangella sediminis]
MNLIWTLRSLLAFGLLVPGIAIGASILVNTVDDELNSDGDCSLREAIHTANTGLVIDNCNQGSAGADTITVLVNGRIPLLSQLDITEAVTIQGLGGDTTVVSGSLLTRVMRIDAPGQDVVLRDLALANGYTDGFLGGSALLVECADTVRLESLRVTTSEAAGTGGGGGILVNPDTGCNTRLEIIDSRIDQNQAAGPGGAIHVDNEPISGNESTRVDSVSIDSTHFRGNSSGASGGAIYANQVPILAIVDSLLEENQATPSGAGTSRGGAVHVRQTGAVIGTVLTQIERSSFVANFAEHGGAITVASNVAAILRNATLFGNNSATSDGGSAILLTGSASMAVFHSTLVDNGSGIASDVGVKARDGASASFNHSIIATQWPTSAYCTATTGGTIQSSGYNIDSGDSCATQATDRSDTSPGLGDPSGFSEPGAPFEQFLLIPDSGSPAIDGGTAGGCPGPFGGNTTEDQRGETRPVSVLARGTGPLCDIGAIEFQPADQPLLFSDRFESGG